MSQAEIKDTLVDIIKPYLPEGISVESLSEESDLINDLKINSAHIVDIVLDIEDKFDVMIEDDAIGEMVKVGDAVRIVSGKIS